MGTFAKPAMAMDFPTRPEGHRMKPSVSCPESKQLLQSYSEWLKQLSEKSGDSSDFMELIRSRSRPFRRPSMTKKQEKRTQPLCRVVVVKRHGFIADSSFSLEIAARQAGINTKVRPGEMSPVASDLEDNINSFNSFQQLQCFLDGSLGVKDPKPDPSALSSPTPVSMPETSGTFSEPESSSCGIDQLSDLEKDLYTNRDSRFQNVDRNRTQHVDRNSRTQNSDRNREMVRVSGKNGTNEKSRPLRISENQHDMNKSTCHVNTNNQHDMNKSTCHVNTNFETMYDRNERTDHIRRNSEIRYNRNSRTHDVNGNTEAQNNKNSETQQINRKNITAHDRNGGPHHGRMNETQQDQNGGNQHDRNSQTQCVDRNSGTQNSDINSGTPCMDSFSETPHADRKNGTYDEDTNSAIQNIISNSEIQYVDRNSGSQNLPGNGDHSSHPKYTFPQLKVLRHPQTMTERLGEPQQRIQPVVLHKLKTFSSDAQPPQELNTFSSMAELPQSLQEVKLPSSSVEPPHLLQELKTVSTYVEQPQSFQKLKIVSTSAELPQSLQETSSSIEPLQVLQELDTVSSSTGPSQSVQKPNTSSTVEPSQSPQDPKTASSDKKLSQSLRKAKTISSTVESLQCLLRELESFSLNVEPPQPLQNQKTSSSSIESPQSPKNSTDVHSLHEANRGEKKPPSSGSNSFSLGVSERDLKRRGDIPGSPDCQSPFKQDTASLAASLEDGKQRVGNHCQQVVHEKSEGKVSSDHGQREQNVKQKAAPRHSHGQQDHQRQRKHLWFHAQNQERGVTFPQHCYQHLKPVPSVHGYHHTDIREDDQTSPPQHDGMQTTGQPFPLQFPKAQNGEAQSSVAFQHHRQTGNEQCCDPEHQQRQQQEPQQQLQTEPVEHGVQKQSFQSQQFRQQRCQKQDSQSTPFRQSQYHTQDAQISQQSSPQDPRELVRRLFHHLEQKEGIHSFHVQHQQGMKQSIRPLQATHHFDDKELDHPHCHCHHHHQDFLFHQRQQDLKPGVRAALPCLHQDPKQCTQCSPQTNHPDDQLQLQPVTLRPQNQRRAQNLHQKRFSLLNRPYSAIVRRSMFRDSQRTSRDKCQSLAALARSFLTSTSSAEDNLDMGYSEDFTSTESITTASHSRISRQAALAYREQSTQTDLETVSPLRTLTDLEETEDGESADTADMEVGNIFALSPISSWSMSPPYCAPLCLSNTDLSCPQASLSRGNIYLPMSAFSHHTSSYNLCSPDADSPFPHLSLGDDVSLEDDYPPLLSPSRTKRATGSLNLRKLTTSALKKLESMRAGRSQSVRLGGRRSFRRHRWDSSKRNPFLSQLRVNQDDLEAEMNLRMEEEEEEAQRQLLRHTECAPSPSHKTQLRANVVKEIITAETEYVKHLRDVIEGYLKQARKRPEMFPVEKVTVIFSNIEVIYDFATKLLADLRAAVNTEESHLTQFGHCFLNKTRGFEIYSEYCNNHPAACEELRDLYRVKRYRHFFEACRLLQEMTEIPLEGFLLTPVQKICKYHLQLAELLKYTPEDHADFPRVQSAVEAMKKIAKLVNERKRKMESIETLAEWQSLVDDWEGPDILDESSELIYSGELNKINPNGWSQERYFFLFDHQLVYCKKDLLKKNSFGYKGRISMDHCIVVSVPDGKDAQYNVTVRNAFKVHDQKRNKWYLMVAKTLQVRQRWLKAFIDERRRVQEDAENNFNIPSHLKQAIVSSFKQKTSGHKSKVKRKALRSSSMRTSKTSLWVSTNATLPRTVGTSASKPAQHSTPHQPNKLMTFLLGNRQK